VFTGLVIAYPVNLWLVDKKLKHGMGTVRALGAGGERISGDPEESEPADHADRGDMGMDMTKTVTRAEINAVAVLTVVVLCAGVLLAAIAGDFSM